MLYIHSSISAKFGPFILLLFSAQLFAQVLPEEEGAYDITTGAIINIDNLPDVDRLFESSSLLKVRLETNLAKLYQYKNDPEYQKAVFAIKINDSIEVVKKIKVKVRGKTRVTVCDYPPLKIDFKNTKFEWKWFEKLSSLKIVTTCKDGKNYSKYLMKEYFTYKAYNIFTEMSYKVRLVELTLIDNQNQVETGTAYAVLIENDKKLAKRTNSKEIELDDTSMANIAQNFYLQPSESNLYNINLLSIYQYMIGNTDWGANTFHNTKIFSKDGVLCPVPFDFDYSGLINTTYAIPSSSLPIKSVKDRHYLGPCCDAIQFDKALKTIMDKKAELYSMLNSDPNISLRAKKEMYAYIQEFYETINDPVKLEKIRNTNCQN